MAQNLGLPTSSASPAAATPPRASADATRVATLLQAWSDGESTALDQLMPLVVDELRRLAQYFFEREAPDHTLQPTALVNEMYLHLRGRHRVQWQDRAQFFGYAARTMRRLLVDHARIRNAEKRGGGIRPLPLEDFDAAAAPSQAIELIELDRALENLANLDPRQAQIVEMRFFGGLGEAEIAQILDISERTVRRDWVTAQLWLRRAMDSER